MPGKRHIIKVLWLDFLFYFALQRRCQAVILGNSREENRQWRATIIEVGQFTIGSLIIFFFNFDLVRLLTCPLHCVCVCLIINNLIYFFFLFLWFAGWLWVLWIVERGSDVFNLHRTSFGRGRGIPFSVHIPYTLIPISKGNHMIIYIAWHLIAIIIIII